MDYVYPIIYTLNGPAQTNIYPAIVIPSGQMNCTVVPAPTQGRVTKLVVQQVSGQSSNFTVDLLNSVMPYSGGNHASGTSPNDPIALYRILPQQSGGAGSAMETEFFNDGYAYRNVDGSFTKNQRNIYLIITPTSSGLASTTWDAAITVVPPI